MKITTSFFLCAIFSINQAYAHHSPRAVFVSEQIQVEGVVSQYLFRNPHVIIYLDVDNDTGGTDLWMAEGAAASGMRRAGWSEGTVGVGEYVRVTGRAGRNNRPMVSLEKIEILDPETHVVLRTPSLERMPTTASVSVKALPLQMEDGRPNLTGVWVQGPGLGPNGEIGVNGPSFLNNEPPPFNEIGASIQAEVDAIDDPQYACEPPGLVRQAGFTPHPVKITQNADHIVIEYEEYAGKRTIFFDEREYERMAGPKSPMGRSRARYENDSLVIESDQISANWTGIFGHQLSEQTTTVETYKRTDRAPWGPILELRMRIHDPGHLHKDWEMHWEKFYQVSGVGGQAITDIQQDYTFIPVDCHAPLSGT